MSIRRIALAAVAAAVWLLPYAFIRSMWYGFVPVALVGVVLVASIPVFLLLLPPASIAAGYRRGRAARRIAAGECVRCGYGVGAMPVGTPCPECGRAVDAALPEEDPWFAGVALGCILVGAAAASLAVEVYRGAEEASFAAAVRRAVPADVLCRDRWPPSNSVLLYDAARKDFFVIGD